MLTAETLKKIEAFQTRLNEGDCAIPMDDLIAEADLPAQLRMLVRKVSNVILNSRQGLEPFYYHLIPSLGRFLSKTLPPNTLVDCILTELKGLAGCARKDRLSAICACIDTLQTELRQTIGRRRTRASSEGGVLGLAES